MDINELKRKLWVIVRADDDPELELENQYLPLTIPERITFFRYILHEWKEGGVGNMLERRYHHEEVPAFLYLHMGAYPEQTPRDLYHDHLSEHTDRLNKLFRKRVPAQLRKEENAAKDILDRQRMLDGVTSVNDFNPDERRFTAQEAADYLGVALKTLYDYNTDGILQPFSPNGKYVFYLKSQLDYFLNNRRKKRKREN